MNILLLEPDNVLRRTISRALKGNGHTVLGVSGAQQAIDQLDKRGSFDLVILELHLVGHSGVEFLYECRSYPEWQDVPIIIHSLVSPHKLTRSQAVLDLLGLNVYLYKPTTSLRKLCNAVDALTLSPVTNY